VAQDKDSKLGLSPASGPPRPPSRPAAPPRRSSVPPSKALSRDPFPGLKSIPPAPGPKSTPPVLGSVPPLRAKLASIEEISSSLLLADDGTLEEKPPAIKAAPPGASVEELSGSVLLDDPDATGDSTAATGADPRMMRPAGALAPDTLRPADAPDTVRPPAAAPHRALLGMPELPTSTPPPDLSALPASILPGPETGPAGTIRPLAPPTEPFAFVPPARDTPSSLPTAIAWPSPIGQTPLPPDAGAKPGDAWSEDPAPGDSSPEPAAPVGGDVEVTSLPRSSLRAARDSMREGLRRLQTMANVPEKRPPWFIPMVAGVGLTFGISLAAFAALALHKGDDKADAPAAPVAAAHPRRVEPAAPPAVQVPCIVTGQSRVLASSATVAAGIEVRAFGTDVALGFAADDHRATVLRVNPASLDVSASVDAPSSEAVHRVTPVLPAPEPAGRGPLAAAIDTDASGDALQGRRTIPLPSPLELGASGGSVWWAHPGGAAAGKLWPIEGEGNVEALRGAVESTAEATTTAIGLRHAGAVWLGTATGRTDLAPRGGLARIEGLGGGVGQPALAINDGVVLAAWADRASAGDPWRLRWVRFRAGEAPGTPGTFTPPAGGQGEQAMSPGVTAVPGGRFLLVWTEGPATRHDVRALTLSRDGQPLGPPLVISHVGINAGQGQAAVTAGQHGLVGFLESASGGFEVVATPIACAM
jgi:hypothetical protein